MAGLCVHELEPVTCADCLSIPRPDADTVTAVASFASTCPDCGQPILAGETIRLDDDQWTHTRCGDDQ